MSESKLITIFQELRRRRVFRVATLYVVTMWPLIQVIDILSPVLNISDSTIRSIVFYFILGFPVAIGSAWLYNLTPHGLVKNKDGITAQNDSLLGNRMELVIIIIFSLVAAVLFMFQDQLVINEPVNDLEAPVSLPVSGALASSYESIAVLPFVPFSDDKQDEYFADGLAEELLNVLAKIQSIRVAARTSSFAYKDSQYNIQKIGRDLGVDAILEGSVRRNDVDNTVRVTAQLIDVRTGSHLWSETYDRKFEDIFKIQDEITSSVVDELKITLLGEEQTQIMTHETASPEAIIAHSRGRSELAKRTSNSIQLAKDYFLQAIDRDKNYATAYASLAEAEILLISYAGQEAEPQQKLAQETVAKALAIDPNLGLAWAAQGLIYMSTMEMDSSLEALKKAIELNPSYAMAYMWYGSLQEDFNDATKFYQKAFQLDPKSPVAGFNLASNYVRQGRDKEAMEVFSKIVDADPFYPNAYFLVGELNMNNGRYDQAIINFEKAFDLGEKIKSASLLAELYTRLGDLIKAREWLSQIPGTNEQQRRELEWMGVIHAAIEDDLETVTKTLTRFSKVIEETNVMNSMDAIVASYFLEDYPQTVKAYEASKKNLEKFSKYNNYRYVNIIYAAHAYNQLERFDKAEILLNEANEMRKMVENEGFVQLPEHWYFNGLLEIVQGNKELGLVSIQRAVDQGWIQEWRLDFEPILKGLKDKPEIDQIRQSLITRVRILREQLAYEQSYTVI